MESRPVPSNRTKGDRRAITVRVPANQYAQHEAAARDAGYDNLSDYVVALLAEHHGLPVPAYTQRYREQLPLLQAG